MAADKATRKEGDRPGFQSEETIRPTAGVAYPEGNLAEARSEPAGLGRAASAFAPGNPAVPQAAPGEVQETCGTYSILELCEQAHWDATSQGLSLSNWDPKVRAEEVHNHLDGCPACARWYGNALRAYEGLGEEIDALLANAEPPGQPRRPLPLPESAPGHVRQRLPAEQGPDAMAQRAIDLDWAQEAAGRWGLTVKVNDATGDSGGVALVEFQAAGPIDPDHLVLPLSPDADGNLASSAHTVAVADPNEVRSVTVTLLQTTVP
jgi:hypothetical protein